MKKALVAAGLSLTLIVAGAAGSASAANNNNTKAEKWTISAAGDEITVGDTATVSATVSRADAKGNGKSKGAATLTLGDGCDLASAMIAPSASQDFTFPKHIPNNPKSDEVTVTWTVAGLKVGSCKFTVTALGKGSPYQAAGNGTIKVNAEDGDDVVTGSASWLLSGLALGLLGLGTGSLMLSRRRMI